MLAATKYTYKQRKKMEREKQQYYFQMVKRSLIS